MRETREELLTRHPIWNEGKHDIVKVFYGDVPLIHYDSKEYEWFDSLEEGTLKNLETVKAYIFYKNGTYDIYRTLLGEVYIGKDGNVLCGNITLKYRGQSYDIILNDMYGMQALTILRLSGSGKVGGWCNKDGQGSPSIASRTEELDVDVIDKVLNRDLKDYGIGIQKYIERVKESYNTDKTNHIMEKCWSNC